MQFIRYTKAGILLIRWLNSLDSTPIILTRAGRHTSYMIDFSADSSNWMRDYYYGNKVFFDPSEYDPTKSGLTITSAITRGLGSPLTIPCRPTLTRIRTRRSGLLKIQPWPNSPSAPPDCTTLPKGTRTITLNQTR